MFNNRFRRRPRSAVLMNNGMPLAASLNVTVRSPKAEGKNVQCINVSLDNEPKS